MPTLVIKRLIKPGFEREYEQSLSEMINEAEGMDGYLGANIARPGNKNHPLYIFSIKFDTQKHLQFYKDSPLRQLLLEKWREQSQKPIREHTLKNIDWWFIVPGASGDMPRYKTLMVSIVAAYPVVLLLSIIFNGTYDIRGMAVKDFFLVLITIFIMNYITMPFFLTILKGWLQRKNESL